MVESTENGFTMIIRIIKFDLTWLQTPKTGSLYDHHSYFIDKHIIRIQEKQSSYSDMGMPYHTQPHPQALINRSLFANNSPVTAFIVKKGG